MDLGLAVDPFFGVLAFFVVVPSVLAVAFAIGPLRRLLTGVFLSVVALPLVLSALAMGLMICFLLTADFFLRSKSITSIVFGSDFYRFEEVLRSTPLANLEAQFGPFDYFDLMESPCLLDYYSEQALGQIPNLLLGGIHKLACYSDWKVGNDASDRTKKLIKDLLNEDLLSARDESSLKDLEEVTLLEIPKLVVVDRNNACIARAVYNTEIVLNGATTKVSVTDHYNFEEVNPDISISFWDADRLQGYSCRNNCFTRQLDLDLSNITTPLRYSEFTKRYFSDDVNEINDTEKEGDRATELYFSSLKKQEKELLASEQFQKWFYLRNEQTDGNLQKALAKSEMDFESIFEGTSHKWVERTWEHPSLFEGYDFRFMFRPEWERSLRTHNSENKNSTLFLRDNAIYYLMNNKVLMDGVVQNCASM